MSSFYEQDELYFRPVQGTFDVAEVAEVISGIGFPFQDETDPRMFVVCPSEKSRERYSARRKEEPHAGFPYVLLICVTPEQIVVNQFAGPDFTPYSKQFVLWLATQYPCTVENEMGKDLTAELPAAVEAAK